MRNIFAIFILAFPTLVNARQIVLDIPDKEIDIVENDVLNAEQWIRDAWAGKLAKCKERLVKQEVDRSIINKEPIPAGDDAIVDKAFSRPDYKSRKDRETEGKKNLSNR